MIEILTILVFAAVQSIFGIGLLFFGTPTLIVLGLSFPETLSVLLPASIAVSLLQVWQGGIPRKALIEDFGLWCLVPLAAALFSGLRFGWDVELELIVAATLMFFAIVRTTPRMSALLRREVQSRPRLYLATIGIVHGLSNLGGGLLGVFAASLSEDKGIIRSHIAFCYLCFAVIQLSILAILTPDVMHTEQLGYAAIAGVVFLAVERCLFRSIASPAFERLFTALIAAYSLLIFLKTTTVFDGPSLV